MILAYNFFAYRYRLVVPTVENESVVSFFSYTDFLKIN